MLIQQHHYQAVPTQPDENIEVNESTSQEPNANLVNVVHHPILTPALLECRSINSMIFSCFIYSLITDLKKRPNNQSPGHSNTSSLKSASKSLTLLWGATGEQEWTPAITTGI